MIFRMFEKHNYTLMKRCVYTFKTEDTRFPVRPLNGVLQLISGFKISFETNVPIKDEPAFSRNMAVINCKYYYSFDNYCNTYYL